MMSSEDDCKESFVMPSKKEGISVCANRAMCIYQSKDYADAEKPLEVKYWNGPISYSSLPICKIYSPAIQNSNGNGAK